MSLVSAVRQGLRTLSNPEIAFKELKKRTFEDMLEDYIKLLLASGFLAALASFIFSLGQSTYLDIIRGVTVDYWHLINYHAQSATATFFFFLFAGTILLFFASLILRVFIRGCKYTTMLSLIFYALTPVLLFSWISQSLVAALFLWSLFLLIVGKTATRS